MFTLLKGAGACHAAVLCLLIAMRDGVEGQSGWRVNLDPPPWMFRWCHKPDLWPKSLAATRPMLNLNFRGPNASVHTQTHANTYSSTAHVHAHKCPYKMQHLKQFEAKSCMNMSPKMLRTFFHCGKDYHMTITDSEASLSFILKLVGVRIEAPFVSCKKQSDNRVTCLVLSQKFGAKSSQSRTQSHTDFQRFWNQLQREQGD